MEMSAFHAYPDITLIFWYIVKCLFLRAENVFSFYSCSSPYSRLKYELKTGNIFIPVVMAYKTPQCLDCVTKCST